MAPSSLLYAVPLVLVVAFALWRLGIFGKKPLPALPAAGPLPLAELSKYYEVRGQLLAWERVRGWELNQPFTENAPAPIDHVVLTDRLLEFCSSSSGKLTLVFNFLVGAIQNVTFDPSLPAGLAAPGQGRVTVYTPSGRTQLIATSEFAQALQRAVVIEHTFARAVS